MATLSTHLVRAARSRYALGLALTAALAISSGSRVRLAASGGATVYGESYAQDTVFATTLQSATATSGILAAPADARRFAVGQLARIYLDCAAIAVLPAGAEGHDLCPAGAAQASAPIQVIIQSVDRSTGALTWSGWNINPLPVVPVAGARIESAVFGPGNIAVDGAGRLYLADTWNSRVAVFAADGSPLYTLGEYGSVYSVRYNPADANSDGVPDDLMSGYPDVGALAVCYDALGRQTTSGCGNDPKQQLGFFNTPNDVAVSSDGSTIVVADSGNHRVQIFKRSTSGSVVASDGTTRFAAASLGTWGEGLGTPAGKMSFPSGVALGPTGRIVVADTDNSRIQTFDPDASAPSPVVSSDNVKYRAATFGQHGDSAGATNPFELNYPLDVALDSSGRIVVADSANNQIKVYNSTGTAAIAQLGGAAGLDKGLFNYPWSVSADANGNLLVSDTFAQRVQVLTRTATGYDANTPVELPAILSPVGVVATPDGGLAVSEFEKHHIVKLNVLGLEIVGQPTVSQSTVASGDMVAVTFTVKNSGRVDFASVEPVLNGLGSGSVVACSSQGAPETSVTAGSTRQLTVCFTAGTPTSALQLKASATAFVGPMQVSATEVNVPAIVVQPMNYASVRLTASASDTRVGRDATFTVTLGLLNQGRVALTNARVTGPTLTGVTLVAQQSDALNVASLALGGTQPLRLTYRGVQEGHYTLTFTATTDQRDAESGDAVTATASVDIDVVNDVDPPVIVSVQVKGASGEAPSSTGWLKFGPATLSIAAADAGIGLQSISYRAITASAGSMSVGGQRSATFAAGPFYSYGQGDTLVSFWAEDLAGNAKRNDLVPREVGAGAVETVQAFCDRLPRQCVWIKIDPLAPVLEHWPGTLSADNSEARIKFNATDSQSGVAAVQLAGTQPGARIEMEPGSTSRGTLVLTTEGPQVAGDVIVTDFAGLSATFHLPFVGDGKPAVRLDRTPPEAFNQVDPAALGKTCTTTIAGKLVKYLCTNKVYASDDQLGSRLFTVQPTSVVPARWGFDYDSPNGDDADDDRDDDDGHHRGLDGHWDDNHDGICDRHPWARYNDDHRYGYTIHDKNRDGHHDANCRERHDNDGRKPAPHGYHWLFRGFDWGYFTDRDRDNHSHWFCSHDHDWDGGSAELHTYTFDDELVPATGVAPIQNPNRVTLVEKVRQSGNEARVRVMSYQYSEGTVAGPVIAPDWAYKHYTWDTDSRTGALKGLNQKMEVGLGRRRVQVIAQFDARTNKTTIREIGPAGPKTVVRTGLALLRMTTDDGKLAIVY